MSEAMTSYAEMDQERKKARPLYLELRALELELCVKENPHDPTSYEVMIAGLRSVSIAHAERIWCRVEERKPGLLRVLRARWDADLEAVRREGTT